MVWARVHGLVLLAAALTMPAIAAPAPHIGVTPFCRNGFFLVQGSSLLQFDERAARHLTVARLPVHVDALAYVERDNRFYGIAGSRVVAVTTGGAVTFLDGLPHGLHGAPAAASRGPQWILKVDDEIVTVRVPDLTVISRVRLSRRVDVGDWDLNPGDGQLYGVSSGSRPRLVRVDPSSGLVSIVAEPAGLPFGSSFGAVAIDPHGVLHALHGATDRLFHIRLASPDRATSSTVDHPGGQSDAAACPVVWDFGDLPGSSARHLITALGELSIGSAVGIDDGLPGTAAITVATTPYDLPVTVRNTTGLPALLAAWPDLDGDGRFTVDERALATVAPGATAVTLRWPPITVAAGLQTARIRLRLYGEIPVEVSPEGPASGGEIEDHVLPVRRPRLPELPPIQAAPPAVVRPTTPTPALAGSATPTPPVVVPATHRPATLQKPSGPVRPHLPVTLFLFAALLIPAVTLAARAVARRGRPR